MNVVAFIYVFWILSFSQDHDHMRRLGLKLETTAGPLEGTCSAFTAIWIFSWDGDESSLVLFSLVLVKTAAEIVSKI